MNTTSNSPSDPHGYLRMAATYLTSHKGKPEAASRLIDYAFEWRTRQAVITWISLFGLIALSIAGWLSILSTKHPGKIYELITACSQVAGVGFLIVMFGLLLMVRADRSSRKETGIRVSAFVGDVRRLEMYSRYDLIMDGFSFRGARLIRNTIDNDEDKCRRAEMKSLASSLIPTAQGWT